MPKYTFICHINKPKKVLSIEDAKGKVSPIPGYSTINRRINNLDIKIQDNKSKDFEDDILS